MENKLISMVDFVLKLNNKNAGTYVNSEAHQLLFDMYSKIWKYATFLKQALKLGFFIPCDENDVPLAEPKDYEHNVKKREYQQAKDRVLFEGFALCDRNPNLPCLVLKKELVFDDIHFPIDHLLEYKIEDLVQHNLTLTASAIKQFEL